MKKQLHQLCKAFPQLSSFDLIELQADIAANGQRQKITLLDGKILDGQNRYAACLAAGVAPQFEDFKGKDALAFVISQNLKRRHLDASQRAMIAASLLETANLQTTVDKAAETLNVSPRSVATAKQIKKLKPKLAAKVLSGKVSLNAAQKKLFKKTEQMATRAPRGGLFAAMQQDKERIQTDAYVSKPAAKVSHGQIAHDAYLESLDAGPGTEWHKEGAHVRRAWDAAANAVRSAK